MAFNPSYIPRDPPAEQAPPCTAQDPSLLSKQRQSYDVEATAYIDDGEAGSNIPLATDVVIIPAPTAPVREDTDRFWNCDYDEETTNNEGGGTSIPKNGIGWLHGWITEISPAYNFYYFATVTCVILALVSLTGVFDSTVCNPEACYICYDNIFYCSLDGNWISMVQLAAVVLYSTFVFARVVCCCGSCADFTYNYLRNKKSSDSVKDLLNRYKGETPTFYFRVVCSHTESSGSGKDRTTHTVTTYDAKERVNVSSCVDVTANFDAVNLKEYRLTKVKLTKSFVADQKFQELKNDVYNANKHRDTKCVVTELMEISDFEPYMLAYVPEDDVNPDDCCLARNLLLNPFVYSLAHVLLFPALPFRIWLCSITGKVKLDIRKKIETQ